MKKQLISNSLISSVFILTLGLFNLFVFPEITWVYYLAVVFFWAMYCAQSVLLLKKKIKPTSFIMLYNATAIIKMVFSAVFIIIYFVILTEEANYYFLGFFLLLYFIYLIINIRSFFKIQNGKTD